MSETLRKALEEQVEEWREYSTTISIGRDRYFEGMKDSKAECARELEELLQTHENE